MRHLWCARHTRRAGGHSRANRWQALGFGISLTAFSVAAGLALPPREASAGQVTPGAFTPYSAANAGAIIAGPFALYTVGVNQIQPTQLNVGLNEINKKATGYNIVTTAAGPVNLASAQAALGNTVNLLSSIEPVVIGPGGVLYLTDGHHTFRALLDSAYGSTDRPSTSTSSPIIQTLPRRNSWRRRRRIICSFR
jgi:hypothetical protein